MNNFRSYCEDLILNRLSGHGEEVEDLRLRVELGGGFLEEELEWLTPLEPPIRPVERLYPLTLGDCTFSTKASLERVLKEILKSSGRVSLTLPEAVFLVDVITKLDPNPNEVIGEGILEVNRVKESKHGGKAFMITRSDKSQVIISLSSLLKGQSCLTTSYPVYEMEF